MPSAADAVRRSSLAGSAINSVHGPDGRPDPQLAEAMLQRLEVYRSKNVHDASIEDHVTALAAVAQRKGLGALREALRQRYPHMVK